MASFFDPFVNIAKNVGGVIGKFLTPNVGQNQTAQIFPIGQGLNTQQQSTAENLLVNNYGQSPGIATGGIVNPQAGRNYSPVPNVSTPFGEAFTNSQGKTELVNPNTRLPGGSSPTTGTQVPVGGLVPGQPNQIPPKPPELPIQPRDPNQFNVYNNPNGGISPQQPLVPFGPSGFGGYSTGQFGGGSGVSGIPGGASALPGSLGGGSRSIGTLIIPTEEELKKRKAQIVNQGNQDTGLGDLFRGLAGIPTANAATGETSTNGTTGGTNQPKTPFVPFIDRLFGQPNLSPLEQQQAALRGNQGVFIDPNRPDLGRISNSQNNLLDSIFNVKEPSPGTGTTGGAINGKEFASATTGGKENTNIGAGDTVSSLRARLQANSAALLAANNARDEALKQQAEQHAKDVALQQLSSGGDVYYKNVNPNTNQIDIFKLTPQGSTHVLMDEFQQKFGGDATKVPDASVLGADFAKKVQDNLSQLLNPENGKIYTQEDYNLPPDNPLKKELDDAIKKVKDTADKFNVNFDLEAVQKQVNIDNNLPKLQSDKKTAQETIDAILNSVDTETNKIQDNPDLSKSDMATRLTFMTHEKQRILTIAQRDLQRVNDEIQVATTNIAQTMKNKIDTYNLQLNNLKDLQAQTEKIQARMEKATDNDWQHFNGLLTQFGAQGMNYKDLTPEQKKELGSMFTNPNYIKILSEFDFKTQKDKALALQLQNTLNRTPTTVNVNIPGLTPTGGSQGRYVPKGTPGLSDTDAEALNTDLGAANDAIVAVQQSSISDADKLGKIRAIYARLSTTYASNKTATGIIDKQLSGIAGQTVNISANVKDAQFGQDLASELNLVKSMFLGSSKTKVAKEAQNRLLSKYGADYSTKISTALKDYLK